MVRRNLLRKFKIGQKYLKVDQRGARSIFFVLFIIFREACKISKFFDMPFCGFSYGGNKNRKMRKKFR